MLKEQFLALYSKIPEAETKLPIIILHNKEITWDAAKKEIDANTSLGKEMLRKLADLEII